MSGCGVRPLTVQELLRARARAGGGRGYVHLADGERQEQRLSFAELDRRACAIGGELRRRGLAGSRALLIYPPGLDYLCGFFGSLFAPAVPVPIYPPDATRLERSVRRLLALVEDARPAAALTTRMVRAAVEPLFALAPALAKLEWIATDDIEGVDGEDAVPDVDPDGAAFLQYTSGSTGTPRGVVLTHRNLLHNSARIREAFGYAPGSRGVIWLPPYHDMGLIGGILQPLYGDIDVVLMSPLDFLARPMRWLEAISRTRAALSGGPNFAFDLCVRKSSPAERARLDLSSWEVAFNGAEPVRAETLGRFAEAFAPAGFRAEALFPCYGLAESTLIATGGPRLTAARTVRVARDELARGRAVEAGEDGGAAPGGDVALVGSGRAFDDGEIAIVDAATGRRCGPGELGEIWLAGDSVAAGYFGRPEETARVFGARTDAGEGPFLRTGDLGFVLRGELFVAGRLADLIIVRGRNHHAADLERTAEQGQAALRPGCSAAFQVAVDDPRVVLVAEVARGQERDLDALCRALRQAVAEEHELQLDAVVLVRAGTVPKTSSGKIERHGCRRAFVDGSLTEVARSDLAGEAGDATPSDPVEPRKREEREEGTRQPPGDDAAEDEQSLEAAAPGGWRVPFSRPSRFRGSTGQEGAPSPEWLRGYLVAAVARLARVRPDDVEVDQPVTALGLDSLAALELQSLLESELGAAVPAVDLLRGATLEEIAARVEPQLGRRLPATRPELGEAIEYPLSVGQRALWFLQLLAPESAAYNVWVAARIVGAADAEALRATCQGLLDRHPSLRAAVFLRDGVPWQRVAPRPVDFEAVDAGDLDEEALRDAVGAEAHRPFDLADGVFRARMYRRRDGSGALLLAAHHMAIDLWSAGLLLAELTGGDQERTGRPFADHVAAQATWVAGTGGDAAWTAWRERLSGHLPALALPLDRPRPRRQSFRGAARAFALDAATTERVRQLARCEQTTAYAVLLSAFAAFLHRVSGQDDLVIGSPTAGRDPGFERSVGYFVNPVPIRADLSGAPSFRQLIGRTRSAVLAAIEHAALPMATMVERMPGARPLDRPPLFQALFALERAHGDPALTPFLTGGAGRIEVAGAALEPLSVEHRASAFDVALVMVEDGSALHGSLRHDTALFSGETAERWTRQFQVLVDSLLADPDRAIDDAPMAGEQESRRCLVEWNHPAPEAGDEQLFHRLVEEQVRQRPDAPAVVLGATAISYRELDARAEALAARLRRLGVGPERPVGVLLERSIEQTVAALGVLKAGGVYLPLDPGLPDERLRFVLEDAGAVAAVSVASLAARAGDLPAVLLDGDGFRRGRRPRRARPAGPSSRQRGLHHLYIRLDRPAQGRGGLAPKRLQPGRRPAPHLRGRPGAPGAAVRLVRLRRVVLRALAGPDHGGVAARGPVALRPARAGSGAPPARRRGHHGDLSAGRAGRAAGGRAARHPHHHHRRRGLSARAGRAMGRPALLQRLRSDRGDGVVDGGPAAAAAARSGDDAAADRRAGARCARLRARPRPAAGPGRRGRRAVRRRCVGGSRLRRPARAHRRALRAGSVRAARRAPVPHRRPGALARRRIRSTSSAAPTTRSRSAASASSRARWRRRSPPCPACASPSSLPGPTGAARRAWSPTWPATSPCPSTSCARSCAGAACRTTFCPRPRFT